MNRKKFEKEFMQAVKYYEMKCFGKVTGKQFRAVETKIIRQVLKDLKYLWT